MRQQCGAHADLVFDTALNHNIGREVRSVNIFLALKDEDFQGPIEQ